MAGKEPHWVRAAEETSPELGYFAEVAARVLLDRTLVKKNVLVAGHGVEFPERSIVCTAQSRFRCQRPDIHVLIMADPGELAEPEIRINTPVTRRFLTGDEGERTTVEPGATFFPASLQELLPTLSPDSINALVFFGIPNLDQQLEEGLGGEVERVLRPLGVFVGSGGFYDGEVRLASNLAVDRAVPLPNNDRGYLYHRHLGFVARKIPRK